MCTCNYLLRRLPASCHLAEGGRKARKGGGEREAQGRGRKGQGRKEKDMKRMVCEGMGDEGVIGKGRVIKKEPRRREKGVKRKGYNGGEKMGRGGKGDKNVGGKK